MIYGGIFISLNGLKNLRRKICSLCAFDFSSMHTVEPCRKEVVDMSKVFPFSIDATLWAYISSHCSCIMGLWT